MKYLWRDLVQNQIGKNDDKRKLLETRLYSFDVSGLGISPLAGHTLVQYSGSLTGRDFRAIAQVAPFVAYDLVSKDCLETWLALSKLIPLIWQPKIEDIDAHCVGLAYQVHPTKRMTLTFSVRHFSILRSRTFFCVPDDGPYVGTTNPNFIYFCTSLNTYDTLVLLSSLLPRHLNHSMQSYARRVFIPTTMPHLETLPKLLHKETGFATCSVVVCLTSVECYSKRKAPRQCKPPRHLKRKTGRPQEPGQCLLYRPLTRLQATWAWTTGPFSSKVGHLANICFGY